MCYVYRGSILPLISSTDIAKQEFREKPQSNAKCATYTQYVFQWSSLSNALSEADFDVQSAVLKAYIQIIPRHVGEGEHISVSLSVAMNPGNANDTNLTSGPFAGEQEISVTHGSDQWIDLNVTESIKAVWPLIRSTTEVQVIIKAEVNCVSQKKVPFNFVNPAEIPLDQDKRRERHLDLQPYLVVFADNSITKQQLMQAPPDVVGVGSYDILDIIEERMKRSGSPDHCSISNYSVNLHDLGLTYVLAPSRINIYKCSGACSHTVLRRNSHLGTNHAKIMASIDAHLQQPNSENSAFAGLPAPSPPCCVPIEYEVVYLFLQSPDSTSSEVRGYSNFKATKCGCR